MAIFLPTANPLVDQETGYPTQTMYAWMRDITAAVSPTSGAGIVTSVGGTAPIVSSGGTTPVISLADTAVTPATYGDANHVGQFTVDQKGRLTFAQNVAITMQTASVTLTNAQIKALPTTPITVIAAPASGFWNKILAITLKTSFAGHAYTGMNAAFASVQVQTPGAQWLVTPYINDNTATPALLDASNIFAGANAVFAFAIPTTFPYAPTGGWQGYVTTPILKTDVDAVASQIAMDNSGVNLGGGNAANSAIVTAYYSVEALS